MVHPGQPIQGQRRGIFSSHEEDGRILHVEKVFNDFAGGSLTVGGEHARSLEADAILARPGDALERDLHGVVREDARGHFLGAQAQEEQIVLLDGREHPDGRARGSEEAEGGVRGHLA